MRKPLVLASLLLATTVVSAADPPAAPARRVQLQGLAEMGKRKPVVGAAITIRAQSDRSRLFVTSTDERGAFGIGGLEEGTYTVEFRRDGLKTVIKDNVALRYPFRGVVEVVMQPSADAVPAPAETPGAEGLGEPPRLFGKLVGKEGEPLPEVRLRLVRADGSVDPRVVLTDRQGAFEADGLDRGRWRLEIAAVGYFPLRVDLMLSEDLRIDAALVPQSAQYAAPLIDLIPEEEPIPPPEPPRAE